MTTKKLIKDEVIQLLAEGKSGQDSKTNSSANNEKDRARSSSPVKRRQIQARNQDHHRFKIRFEIRPARS